MGSSGEDPNKGIDGSAGGLVWVRRRNGSWWPGKILSPDELPEGCVPTPRSGTPVKLLGREDASVDWYNLEKSKRVKAFHCGEYEDCIKKAKASTSNLSKKGVKYARREDAILHALELENAARLGKDHPDFSPTPNGDHHNINESPPKFHPSQESQDHDEDLNNSTEDDDGSQESQDVDGGHEQSQSGLSFEEESKHSKTTNDSEEDGIEGVKRMKGLEDLGIGVASSKSSPMKRKRSQDGHGHESLKKKNKNKRRTLTKVMECTEMVSVPVVSEPVVSDSKVSELESNESKNANSAVLNNNKSDSNESKNANSASDACKQKDNEISSTEADNNEDESLQKLFDVPLIAHEKNSADATHKVAQVGGGAQSSQNSHIETLSLCNEDHNESGSTSSGTANVWQLKGKRNSRSRKVELTTHEAETHAHRGLPMTATADLRAPQRLLPYRQSRFTVNPKYDSSDFDSSLRHHMTGSGLYDVTLEVKSQYRPQHVPYISLMSKSKGQPIIGHPVAVEVLEDGFCDSMSELCYSSSSELDLLSEQKVKVRPTSKISPFCIRGPSSKSPKTKKNGNLSKKIRKLSSLTGSHRLSREEKKQKPVLEKLLKGPSIACVPLNVVFSRINAALSGSVRR